MLAKLSEIGFTSQLVTGYYGDITFNNVAYFQIINSLTVTGWVDKETYNCLTQCNEEQEVQEIETPEPPIAIITNISESGYGKNRVITFEAFGNETTEEIFIGLYNGDNFADYTTIQAQNGKYEVKITEEGTYTIFTIARSKEGIQTKGFEMKFEVTDRSNPITTRMYFLMGVGEELWATVKGTAEFLMDIPGGVKAIGEGIQFFWRARTPGTEESDQFQEMVVAIWEEAKNGTDNEQARLLGKATVQVVLTFVAIKGVAKSVDTLVTMARKGTLGATIVNGAKKPVETAKTIAAQVQIAAGKIINQFDDVVAYIKKYHKLPDNYITKSEARKLGWKNTKGNLAEVAPGKSMGGDIYYNDKKLLPEAPGRVWYEADINYTSGYRGNERLLYSNDGLFYKTIDHYETFVQIGG